MDRPCGQGGPMLQSQRTGLVLAPRRGPCPPGLTCLQETEDHTAQEAGAHGGGGVAEGPLVCVWIRGERGSPGSPSEMSLSLQAPEPTCHSGATPLPPEAQIRNEPERTVHNRKTHPDQQASALQVVTCKTVCNFMYTLFQR